MPAPLAARREAAAVPSPVPVPPATRADGTTPAPPVETPRFTAREAELAALAGALAVRPAVVLVEGELGIGKSRLVSEYLAREGRLARPMVACCPPFRHPQTLAPVADAVRAAVADIAGLGLSGLAGALRPLFPEWAPGLPAAPEPAEDATAARHRVFRALAELLDRLGTGLLVVEDAHWADEATLEFLLFLVSRPAASPQAPSLLVTSRPEDVPAASLLLRLVRLATAPRGVRLVLGPLNVAGTAGLVSSMLSLEQVTGSFAAFLHQQTGGVPLAVEESVRFLAARADLARHDGRWMRRRLQSLAVPPTIRDSVLERYGRLTPEAREVLDAAAVLAQPANENTIAVVAGLVLERARCGLSEALGCSLLSEDPRGLVSFRHALACRAVYEAVAGPFRRLLHQRAGEALTQGAAPAATLARHFREAGDAGRWLRYAEQAADLALAAGDQVTSATLLSALVTGAALDAGETGRLTDKIVLLALPEESQLRDLAAALHSVLDTGTLVPGEEALLRFQLGRLLMTLNEVDASRAELERAVRDLPPGSLQATRAMMLLGSPRGSSGTAREHLLWLRRAAGPAVDVAPVERLRLLIDKVTGLLLLGEESGWAQAAEIPWHPRAPGESLQVTRGHVNLGELATLWGRYAEARIRLEHAAGLADRHQFANLQEGAAAALAHLDWLAGAWHGLADRVAELADDEDLHPMTRLEAVLVSGLLAAAAGDSERAGELLGRCVGEARRRDDVQYLMEPSAALAWMHLMAGEVTEALRVTQQPIELAARKGTWLWACELAPARVATLTAAGLADEAASLVESFRLGLQGLSAPAPKANMTLCRAILAESRSEHANAAALFGRAAGAWQKLPRPYGALLAAEWQARSLLSDGQSESGLRLLSQAADGLRRLGAVGDADRAAATLGELGAGRRKGSARGRPGYGDQLSPRESEVVRLVARGQSNREIAEMLVLSRQTVEGHVHSAMRKLRVSSRTALAVTAVKAGII